MAVLGWIVVHASLLVRHLRLDYPGVGSRRSRMLLDALGLHRQTMSLGLGGRDRREDDRRGNGRCRRHKYGEQNQQPEANQFHASSRH